MEKKFRIIVSSIFAFVILIFSFVFFNMDVVSGSPSTEATAPQISMSNLDVDISVSRNNVVSVSETFNITFDKGGYTEVIVFVPYAGYVYHSESDKSVSKTISYSKIKNIKAIGEHGEKLNLYYDEQPGYITIGIKDSSGYSLNETRFFKVSYDYELEDDKNNGYDEVYFNVVGTNSLISISNVTFHIDLPEEIDESKVQTYYGVAGSTETLDVSVSGNTVVGSCANLEPGEGITFRALYEDGFFVKSNKEIYSCQIIALVFALSAILMGLVCFFVLRQKKDFPQPVELVPYDGLTPFNADFMANGDCSSKAVSATIICLANSGYITIKEISEKQIEFTKTKKEMKDNEVASLRQIYNAMFASGKDTVLLSELQTSFAVNASAVITGEKMKNKTALYDAKYTSKFNLFKILAFVFSIVVCFMFTKMPSAYFGHSTSLFGLFFVVLFIIDVYVFFVCFMKRAWIYDIVAVVLMTVYLSVLYFKHGFFAFDRYLIGYFSMIIVCLIPLLINKDYESKYTEKGKIQKGRVLGFKNYIQMCEVDQIKMFAKENPNYYFDVLPYAYVFGLSNVWMNKFKTIEVQIPTWLSTSNGTITDFIVFNSVYNSLNANLSRQIMVNRIAGTFNNISSGKGFSGGSGGGHFSSGGFSGGGHGGGGFGAR